MSGYFPFFEYCKGFLVFCDSTASINASLCQSMVVGTSRGGRKWGALAGQPCWSTLTILTIVLSSFNTLHNLFSISFSIILVCLQGIEEWLTHNILFFIVFINASSTLFILLALLLILDALRRVLWLPDPDKWWEGVVGGIGGVVGVQGLVVRVVEIVVWRIWSNKKILKIYKHTQPC